MSTPDVDLDPDLPEGFDPDELDADEDALEDPR